VDEFTIEHRIADFGLIVSEEEEFFPITHTIGWEISEVVITLLDEAFYLDLSSSFPSGSGLTHPEVMSRVSLRF
jgi:hypothetical protein